MYHVLISGYYGSGNCGDDALLYAITMNLKKIYPDIKITVLSMNPDETKKTYSVESIHKANFPCVLKAIAECDLLLSGGGTLLQDISSTRSLLYYLTVISVAKKLRKKVVLYANGIGPILRKSNRSLVKRVINDVDLITLRDNDSYEELKALGISNPRIEVTADPVLTLHDIAVSETNGPLHQDKPVNILPSGRKLVGFCLRKWKNVNFEKAIANYADYIKEKYDYDIVLIPTQSSQDTEINDRIRKLMKYPPIILKQDNRVDEWLSLMGKLQVLVSMRLHPLIFASMQKTPMIGISFGDTKVESFLKLVSQPSAGDIKSLDMDRLCKTFDEVEKNRDDIITALDERLKDLKSKALENDALVATLLEENRE